MSRSRKGVLLLALVLGSGLAIHVFRPRTADLRTFDPAEVARLETEMWRHYYQHQPVRLFHALYTLSREQYRFSPWDSLRLSHAAARAAMVFQPTRSRTAAFEAALPRLERYFALIRSASTERFDVSKIARLELEWWQLRREDAPPAQYGQVIARVLEEMYGTTDPKLTQSALLRAEIMRYRDEHRAGIVESDWVSIEEGLLRSYRLLRQAVDRGQVEPVTQARP